MLRMKRMIFWVACGHLTHDDLLCMRSACLVSCSFPVCGRDHCSRLLRQHILMRLMVRVRLQTLSVSLNKNIRAGGNLTLSYSCYGKTTLTAEVRHRSKLKMSRASLLLVAVVIG